MNIAGIDLGVHKIALFMMLEENPHPAVLDVDDMPRPLTLRMIAGWTQEMVTLHDIDQVWIEDVIVGNNRKYSLGLAEVKGAVMSQLPVGLDVRLVDNKTWKKELIGNGNASKDQIRNYIDVTHGAYAPLCGDDQDLYDSACIAIYGRQIITRARHLQLTSE